MTETKPCRGCGKVKALGEFPINKKQANGRRGKCKDCWNEYRRAYHKIHPRLKTDPLWAKEYRQRPEVRARRLKYAAEYRSRPEVQERRSDYLVQSKNLARDSYLRRKYGITFADEQELMAAQDGVCPLCDVALTAKNRHVDHDHRTGAIRGVLCRTCNQALGRFEDSIEGITRVLKYLQREPPLDRSPAEPTPPGRRANSGTRIKPQGFGRGSG